MNKNIDSNYDYDKGDYYSYSIKDPSKLFMPDKVDFDKQWFIGSRNLCMFDCVAHAINYAVGFSWFKKRE